MKILYLSQRFDFKLSGIYADLMNALVEDGNDITVVSCKSEKQFDYGKTYFENGCKMLYVKVDNQFGINVIKKALVQLSIPSAMLRTIKKHIWDEQFDLILYPTPPITFANVVEKCKQHYDAKTYLMLKDIFPQNAVDLGMIKKNSLIHKYYQRIEARLYNTSDKIGCMSLANQKYVMQNNQEEIGNKTEIFPNTVDSEKLINEIPKRVRENDDVTTFLFGGNLGKPQAVDFLLDCICELRDYDKAQFLIIGSGSEMRKIQSYVAEKRSTNIEFHEKLPREEYEKFVADSDVGLIMLNYDFTIPNCPARTLSYMAKGLPILAATDEVTDIKDLVESLAECGMWCPSNDKEKFCLQVKRFCEMDKEDLKRLGENGKVYLRNNFDVKRSVDKLNSFMSEKQDLI